MKDDRAAVDKFISDNPIDIQAVINRPITAEDIYHLLSLYPYVTICDQSNAYIGPDEIPEVIQTTNGWRMCVYESAICLGNDFLTAEAFAQEHKGLGTLVKQGLDAVREMLEYVRAKKKWSTVEVVFGHYRLRRMVWMHCRLLGQPVFGFDPSIEDEVAHAWFEKIIRRLLYPSARL